MNWFAVSDVASLVGKNKYQSAEDTIEKYRKRYFPELESESEPELESEPESEPDFKTLCNVGNINPKMYIDKITPVTNSNEIVESLVESLAPIVNTIPITMPEIKNIVQSEIYKQHGKRTESYVEDWINENVGTLTDQQKGAGINIITHNDVRWRVFGKVDGIVNDSVVEIKNRQNRLFHYVPEYEKVQCQLYMHIFKKPLCKLVQHYKNQYIVDDLCYDKDYVLDILEKLTDIIKAY